MEYLPPVILILVFGLFAIFVKPVRITACAILMTVLYNLWMMESFNRLAALGDTVGLLMMGVINVLAAMALLSFHRDPDARKAPHQAIVFILFAVVQGVLANDIASRTSIIYDVYEGVIWVLTAAHIIVMGGYYEELYKNTKKTLGGFYDRHRYNFSFVYRFTNGKRGSNGVDIISGSRCNDSPPITDSDRVRKRGKTIG